MILQEKNKKVIVGISGGVDSSVAVALLKEKGCVVQGVFLRLWKNVSRTQRQKISADEKAAREVAQKLKIKFQAIDARARFKKEVVGYFLKEYASGRTPNPCVFCNENFKFRILLEIAKKVGADFVATGHYAKIKKITKNCKLLEANDKNKDQSYFLYRLGQKQLTKIIFPLGEYEKEEVKKMAKKLDLPVWQKKESQDICFLCDESTTEFLKKNLKLKKGEIVDEKGEVIGQHSGLALYTLGQRKGINIGGTGPYYVSGKKYEKNRLIVSNKKEESGLFFKSAVLEKMNWINEKPKLPLEVLVRIRYRNLPVYATMKKSRGKYVLEFAKAQRAVTPGQSAVFYTKKGEVLGGGIIVK